MPGSILGNAVPRLEDPELLRGGGTFIDNLELAGKAHLVFVRSPWAHARIAGVDKAEAETMNGVVAVFTGTDLDLPAHQVFVTIADEFARPPLARSVTRFVGEPIVAVVAETVREAVDAAEAVVVDYEPLEAVVDMERALADDAPALFPERGDNVSFSNIDPYDDGFFADADIVVRGRYENQRIAVVPMEPNCFAAVPPTVTDDGRLTVYASTQMPHLIKPGLASILPLDEEDIQVIAPHVGGGFGGKAGLCPEYTAVTGAALALGRPVTWIETRSENLVGLPHSRGQVQYVELGCKNDGSFTGLRARIVGDSGAYPGIGTMLPMGTRRMSMGVYDLPKFSVDVICATTNTTPTGAYRGAGRPEAASMVERVVDQAALELGIDGVELRRKNFIPDDAFPFDTFTDVTYDSGAYDVPLVEVLRLADHDALRAEQATRRESHDSKLLGIGLATYVEITSGGGTNEFASVDIHEDGSATMRAGTSAHGQGHLTSYAMIVADKTGIPLEKISLVQSDTDAVPRGGGTGGSRSLQLAGSAIWEATDIVIEKARALAAELLEASLDDIVVNDDGRVGVAGVPASALGWDELAVAARGRDDEGLAAVYDFEQEGATFPFGAHIAVVEVDKDTGEIELLRHIAVDDCGRVLNPLIVAGQQHGGVASGISQALYEHFRYDEAGNPQTANLADYALPSAAEFPGFEVASTETPTPYNPLGAKGIGEAGTIGATPAVQNAVIDAVAHLGIRHLDMPHTPERMWRAITDAEAGIIHDPWREPPAAFDRLRAASS